MSSPIATIKYKIVTRKGNSQIFKKAEGKIRWRKATKIVFRGGRFGEDPAFFVRSLVNSDSTMAKRLGLKTRIRKYTPSSGHQEIHVVIYGPYDLV